MHARKQIRAAFVAALTGTTTANTIIDGGVFPMYDLLLPAITVQVRGEIIDPEKGRIDHIQYRTGEVTLTIYEKILNSIDDVFDDLSEQIETAVFQDTELKALTNCVDLIQMETETSGEGENEIGICALTFAAKYMTHDGVPGVIL